MGFSMEAVLLLLPAVPQALSLLPPPATPLLHKVELEYAKPLFL